MKKVKRGLDWPDESVMKEIIAAAIKAFETKFREPVELLVVDENGDLRKPKLK